MKPTSLFITAAILLSLTSVAEAAGRHRINLPGGRLGDALILLGRQTGASIGLSDPLLAAQPVAPLSGEMSAEQALRRMLKGRGARYVAVDGDAFRIVRDRPRAASMEARSRAQPTPLPAVQPAVEDIIVTGARRPVRLSSYPGAVDIVSGSDPEVDGGIRGTEALAARLPAIASTHLGPGRNKLFIRGIADSSFNGPTQATTGQYLGETRLNYNAPDPDLKLYDIDRIEVMQGPQGTLYGAGSLGGIIRILPNRPRLGILEGSASAGVSTTQHGDPGADLAGMINLPLLEDRLALRIAAYGTTEGGYIDDTRRGLDDVNRVRTIGGRAGIGFVSADDWRVDIGATVQRIKGEDGQFADRDGPPLTRESAVAQPFRNDYLLADLVVGKSWNEVNFVTSFGLVKQLIDELYDATPAREEPHIFAQRNDITLLSAESRLSSGRPGGGGWVIGASFIRNQSKQRREAGPAEAPLPMTGVSNGIDEAALFGEASVRLLKGFTATAGGRLTRSHLSGAALDVVVPVLAPLTGMSASRDQTAFLPSLALAWEAAPDLLLFARYQESFRPGGLAVSDDFVRSFRNDDVSTIEGGVRYGFPGRGRFDASASFAYTDWNDIQADTIGLSGLPTTANIGNGRIYTLDARLDWRPIDGLNLELAGIANDSRVDDPLPSFVIAGRFELPNVADFSGRIAADYASEIGDGIGLRLNAAARYTGKSRLGVGAILGEDQGGWLDVSLGARLDRGPHSLSLTLTNLLDEVGNRFAMGSPFTLVERPQITPLRPRTIRLGWQTRF